MGERVAILGPNGSGKSTLLAQWAASRIPRVSWITIDEHDNDPAVLLAYLTAALDRIEVVDSTVFRPSGSTGAGITDVGRLVACIAAMSEPVSLVLDQAEAITNRASRDIVAELAVRLPAGSQIAIGSRHAIPVPVARLSGTGSTPHSASTPPTRHGSRRSGAPVGARSARASSVVIRIRATHADSFGQTCLTAGLLASPPM